MMPITKPRHFLLALMIWLISCQVTKKTAINPIDGNNIVENLDPISGNYHATNTLTNDLVHTKLDVSFDWVNKQLKGKALLTLSPYFYPSNILYLNARGMELHEVSIQTVVGKVPLTYTYQKDSIIIELDRSYIKGELYQIFIDYTAKPEDLKKGGSAAIKNDKGLYFINADGKEGDKPQQIWTQGETQSNSVWFPTIDSPNERMTQEIFITVDTAFTTLSNGLLISSVNNNDGTRTDYWKQSLGAAPYLTMMAVGKYAVVKDKWRNLEVNYYVEPPYEAYARLIFGHTPEMMEFFSNRLGIDFPWEKYSQVVVRDYVSGAMENTTAVIHNEFIQQDSREILDGSYEEYISHELFHQWFGNLVTCESWANVALNESFATYGAFLWSEYKYGRDEADYGLQQDLKEFLSLSGNKNLPLIRYNYESREAMFDNISYQKGGRILHMLRKLVGEEAFFSSLKLYLQTNKFKTVEAHQLRIAFEEITGQDLNWFFNQWFFNGGNPDLKISYAYDKDLKMQWIYTEQNQDFSLSPLYKIPVDIDFYGNGKVIRKRVVLEHAKDTFGFPFSEKPDLVNFDAEKMLLATKADIHTNEELIFMFYKAPLYLDRYEALARLSKNYSEKSEQAQVVKSALADTCWNIRATAIKNISTLATAENSKKEIENILIAMTFNDPKAEVRAEAIKCLGKYYKENSLKEIYQKAAGDSSYEVMGEAIQNYVDLDSQAGMQWIKQYENIENENVTVIVSGIYAVYGNEDKNPYFIKAVKNARGINQYYLVSDYVRFLSRCKLDAISEGVPVIADVARNGQIWWIRMNAMNALVVLSNNSDTKANEIKLAIRNAPENKKTEIEYQILQKELYDLEEFKESIKQKMKEIKKTETDSNLMKIYGDGD